MTEAPRSATDALEARQAALQSRNDELVAVNVDLRQKVEAATRANDELNHLIASMNMATVLVDRELRIKGFSPRVRDAFRLLPGDLGRPLKDLRHPRRAHTLAGDVQRTLRSLEPVEREVGADDGHRYLVRVTVDRTGEGCIDGAVLNFIDVTKRRPGCEGFATIARDLPERQALERQRESLRAAEQQVRQRLQQADALQSDFLAVMSHELKHPLNLVLMNAELIGRSAEGLVSPPLTRAVNLIRGAVHAQAKIIDDLLDLSRIDAGQVHLARAEVPWAPALARIVDALRARAETKGVALRLQAEPLVVLADAVGLDQIAWNLLDNALKFTPGGGAISVRLSREASCAVLEVQDTGRGIDAALLPRVFERFEQSGLRAAVRTDGGLGIGLALVRRLAVLQGGSVQGDSAGTGCGATFTVRLPLAEATATPRRPVQHQAGGLVSKRPVLLVDDDADTLEALAALLALEGLRVVTAGSARDALARACDVQPGVVISDIAMPGMDGLQLVAALRRLPGLQGFVAVAVSGFGRPEDAERSLAAGFDAHLCKPLSLQKLAAVLGRADPLPGA